MAKVDSKGRIVLPQDLRERLGLEPGVAVDVREEDGHVVVEREDDPESIIQEMNELVDGIKHDRERTPYDELDPHSKKQVDAIRRQANQDESSNE